MTTEEEMVRSSLKKKQKMMRKSSSESSPKSFLSLPYDVVFNCPSLILPDSVSKILKLDEGIIDPGKKKIFVPIAITEDSVFLYQMRVNRWRICVGLVGGKIYVIGGYSDDEISAEAFDLKSKSWE
ncbi:predicted protein [Arabidopsis lyrata subsp. lyrata]|uniref:Predicted protein n=1 Tax=Arabidopsis lyrata subsp. lyrata TaxID=81972 RepID=D7LLP4_ARALL|nr:predicted protein [Arabidopsis lyrata subsp. lyrata]